MHRLFPAILLIGNLSIGAAQAQSDQSDPRAQWDNEQFIQAGQAFAARPTADDELTQISEQPADPIAVSTDALESLLDAAHHVASALKTVMGVEAIQEQGLAKADNKFPKSIDTFTEVHDLITAMDEDIARAPSGPYTMLSSHTLEQEARIGLDWVLDSDRLKDWVTSGAITQTFANRIGYFAFGADDIAAAIGKIAGGGRLDNPDVVGQLLDGINKSLWGAVGLLVSRDNPVGLVVPRDNRTTGETFAAVAGYAAEFGRDLTLGAFISAYEKSHGVDQVLLAQYAQAQTARTAHGIAAQSIEEFYNFDAKIVGVLDDAQRREADLRFGISDPARRTGEQAMVITRTWSESYRQVCREGICVQTALTPTRAPSPVPEPLPAAATDAAMRPGLGGVDLSVPKIAAGLRLPPIRSVVLDPATGSVVFVGPAKVSAGGIKISDLAMAIWLSRQTDGQPIQFSLDPADPSDPGNGRIKAVYIPKLLQGHSAGATVFAADLLLKDLAFGERHGADYRAMPWTPPVDGFTSFADLAFAEPRAAPASAQWARFWIVVSDVTVKRDGMAISLEPHMAIKARRQVPDPSSTTGLRDVDTAPDAVEVRWAKLATKYFEQLSQVSPELARVRQLAAAVACAKWLDQQGARIDMKKIADIVNADRTPTVSAMSALSINRETERRLAFRSPTERGIKVETQRLSLTGGVDLTMTPKFIPDDGSTRRLYDETMTALRMAGLAHPVVSFANGDEIWEAVALPLLQARGQN